MQERRVVAVETALATGHSDEGAVPNPGKIDNRAMTAAQNTTPAFPTTAKAAPASPPCTIPSTSVLFRIVRDTKPKIIRYCL